MEAVSRDPGFFRFFHVDWIPRLHSLEGPSPLGILSFLTGQDKSPALSILTPQSSAYLENPDPCYTLLYRFQPLHWRVQGSLGWIMAAVYEWFNFWKVSTQISQLGPCFSFKVGFHGVTAWEIPGKRKWMKMAWKYTCESKNFGETLGPVWTEISWNILKFLEWGWCALLPWNLGNHNDNHIRKTE